MKAETDGSQQPQDPSAEQGSVLTPEQDAQVDKLTDQGFGYSQALQMAGVEVSDEVKATETPETPEPDPVIPEPEPAKHRTLSPPRRPRRPYNYKEHRQSDEPPAHERYNPTKS